jgi:hypothetical protein
MSLKTTFHKAGKIIFKVFKSLLHKGHYISVSRGFDGDETEATPAPIDIIIDTFAERDTQFLSFYNQIQPTDVKGLVRGEQLSGVELSTEDKVRVGTTAEDYPVYDEETGKWSGKEYHVIAWNTDPAEAVYTLLLRMT